MDYIVAAVIAGAVSVLVAGLSFLAGRRKNEADAADVLTNLALKLVDPLEERIDAVERENAALHAELAEVKSENAALHRWSQILFTQVIENGGTPLPFDAMQLLEDGP